MLISGIFFEASGSERPTREMWKAGYDLLAAELRRHAIEPNYQMIDTLGGSLRLQRIGSESGGGASSDFADTDTIALVAAPSRTRNPASDWFAQCGISFQQGNYCRLTFTFLIAHEYCSLNSQNLQETLLTASKFFEWDFGWALARDKEQGVELYVSGGGIGERFTQEDRRRTNAWYGAYAPVERRIRIRDVFPYNVVGRGHLSQTLLDGRTLREFIDQQPDSTLDALTSDLWLWKVKPGRTEDIRAELHGSGLIASE